MPNLIKQKNAAGKLIEFNMVKHTADEIYHRTHADKREHQSLFQGQGKILLALSQTDGLSQKDLADQLDLTAQSTAEFVNKLVKKHLVTKEKSTTDRRKTVIRLTAAGRKSATDTSEQIPEFLQGLTDTELDQLAAILTKMNASLYDEINTANPSWYEKFHNSVTDRLRDWFS